MEFKKHILSVMEYNFSDRYIYNHEVSKNLNNKTRHFCPVTEESGK